MTAPGQRLRRCALSLALAPLLALPGGRADAAMPPASDAMTPPENPGPHDDLGRDRRMALELYRATTTDAETFERAIERPAVRRELERVFKKKLTDETLNAMARQARSEADHWANYVQKIEQTEAEQAQDQDRRIPGQPARVPAVAPIDNPTAVPPPRALERGGYLPVPDRWRILDALGRRENLLDPYNTNTLKADKPIFGDDWFFNIDAVADTLFEPTRVPIGIAGQGSPKPGENNSFGPYGHKLFTETDILTLDLIKGDTAFKPPELEFRFTPVFNFNHTDVGELAVLNVNPSRGDSRNDSFVGLQEGFVDYHIRNVSEYYDFDSIRVGIQPFNVDFRGFLFQDNQLGVRLFGDRDDNRWQYNVAYFRLIEKDTNSGLNDVGKQLRRDGVGIINLYRQDFPVSGFTSQLAYVRDDNNEGGEQYYDNNGFLVRPAQIGDGRGYNYNVNYLGYNGDGHFGRFNLTTSLYYEIGHQDHNQFTATPQNASASISGFFAAAEPSIDFDFARIRLSALYASGDAHPQGGHETGFDSIMQNPQFAGSDTSYFIRQGIPFIGGGSVALTSSNSVLADLRTSQGEGQSNFVNPGIELAGIGGDIDILPELRLSTNFNYLRFANTASLEFLRQQANIPNTIGYDLSAAFTYRPLFTQNVVLRLSGAVLLPGDGLRAIYQTSPGASVFSNGQFLYSVLANVIFTY